MKSARSRKCSCQYFETVHYVPFVCVLNEVKLTIIFICTALPLHIPWYCLHRTYGLFQRITRHHRTRTILKQVFSTSQSFATRPDVPGILISAPLILLTGTPTSSNTRQALPDWPGLRCNHNGSTRLPPPCKY